MSLNTEAATHFILYPFFLYFTPPLEIDERRKGFFLKVFYHLTTQNVLGVYKLRLLMTDGSLLLSEEEKKNYLGVH